MLSILFIYFIGKAFYTLAEKHSKHKWLFAILGVVSYYVGTALWGIILLIYYALNNELESIDTDGFETTLIAYISIPVGLLICWAFYRILKSFWTRSSSTNVENEVLDATLINNNTDL